MADPSLPLVGRRTELSELQRAADAVLSGAGGVFLIEGEPGIGKTHLAREFAAHASSRGVSVLWAFCSGTGNARQLWPWIHMAHQIPPGFDLTDPVSDKTANVATENGASPYSAGILSQISGAPPDRLDQIAKAVLNKVTTIARFEKLVIIFEDIEQGDNASLELLAIVTSKLRHVLVILTCATAGLRALAVQQNVLAHKLLNDARRLPLKPFEHDEFVQFVESYAGVCPDRATMLRLEQMSGGNPRFAQLIVDSGLARFSDYAIDSDAYLTPMVRMATELHLQAVSRSTRSVLTIAAMIGAMFELRVLEELSDDPPGFLADAISEGQASGLVAPVPNSPGVYTFVHELVRKALCDDLPKSQTFRLHKRIGQALRHFHGFEHEYLGEIATHLFRGLREIGTDPTPSEYCRRAAEDAESRQDFPKAIHFYRMALASLGSGDVRLDEWRCDLLLALSRAQMRSGDRAGASRSANSAADLAELNQDSTRFARAVLALAGNDLHLAFGGRDAPQIEMLLEKALRMPGDSTEPVIAMVATRLASELYSRGESTERQQMLLERAAVIAEGSKDPESLLSVLRHRQLLLFAEPGKCDARLSNVEEMLTAASLLGRGDEWCYAFIQRQAELLRTGDLMRAELNISSLTSAAHTNGETALAQLLILWSGMRALIDGRFEEALSTARQFLKVAETIQPPVALVLFFPTIVAILREFERLEEVEPIAARAAESHPWLIVLRATLAQVRFGLGDIDGARAILRSLLSQDFAAVEHNVSMLLYCAILAELSAELGEQSQAGELYKRLLPYQSYNIVLGPMVFAGPAARYLGILASMQGRFEDAELHFLEAAQLSTRTAARPWVAYTQINHSRMLLDRNGPGDSERAMGLIASALNTARSLKMNDLQRRAEELKRRAECAGQVVLISERFSQSLPANQYLNHHLIETEAYREVAQSTDLVPRPIEGVERPGDGGRSTVNIFKREGDYWTIVFNGKTIRLKHAKGVGMIAWLLRHPRRDFLALALERAAAGGPSPDAELTDGRFARDLPSHAETDDAGPRLDMQARSEYQKRLVELRAALAEAKAFNDIGRVSQLEQEIDFLEDELCRGMGLRGRARKWPSEIERSRINVTNAVRSVVAKLRTQNSELARYLSNTIRTGRFCSFEPDPLVPADWTV
jgi:tetratricopeptide (TPR) repeat protein